MKEFVLGCWIGAVLTAALFTAFPANASQTLDLEDEYREDGYKVCIYSNGRSSAVVYKKGAGSCPSKHIKYSGD